MNPIDEGLQDFEDERTCFYCNMKLNAEDRRRADKMLGFVLCSECWMHYSEDR